MRAIIHAADPEIVEEWKWVKPTATGTPVFSHGGIVCTGGAYKNVVKMTFAKGAVLHRTLPVNSSLEENVRRAIDIHEGENKSRGSRNNAPTAPAEATKIQFKWGELKGPAKEQTLKSEIRN